MNSETHQLVITPIGAGREVGRSCVIMEYQNRTIMFDCGIHMNRSHKGKNALPYFENIKSEKLDVILITHFHLDHCGALPYFLKNYNFKGKIFMTRPTKEIYNLVLRDSIKVKSENLDQDLMNEASIEQSLKNIELIDYKEEKTYKNIKIKCYNAGHVLGAAMFMVEIDGVRVLYTGDYSREKEIHLQPADIPNEKIHVLICESTYGDSLHESRQQREQQLVNEIVKTLRQGGNVLLPVFATGRIHELLLILDDYWQRNPDIQQFPIFTTCTLATKCINIFQKYINKLGERFQKGENLFNFKFVQTKKHLDDILRVSTPKVVMASPGLLQSGHSKQLFELWCQDSRSQVIVTGQAVQDTIAWKLVNNYLPKYIVKTNEVDVRIRAFSISFSAHADYNQTSEFINKVRPEHIILVHGSAQKCADLSNKIKLNFKGIVSEVWTPDNQMKVQLTFERSNINQTGCKAIGTLADEIEKFQISFNKTHAQHMQIEVQPGQMDQEQCVCCTNEISFNGILLNTEHGFLLVDENDQEALDAFGVSQIQLKNSMYVPFTGSLEQVYNLVKKVSQNQIDMHHEDEKIFVHPHLEIAISESGGFLQFKWTSNPESDQLADTLAYLVTEITPGELQDLEKGRQKRSGLMNILNETGFETQIDDISEEIKIKFLDKLIAIADLNQLKCLEDIEPTIRKRLENVYNSFS